MMPDHHATAPNGSPAAVRRQRSYEARSLVVETGPLGGMAQPCGVIVLPPLGYEDTCSYRPLRALAEQLAVAGHVVLRPDWPGLGDAADAPRDEDWLKTAVDVIVACADSLRARGLTRLCLIGVRAGGLLALEALQTGRVVAEDLVLWGTPASGSRFLREQRAFHKTAAGMFGQPPADAPALPEGAIEAGGFAYSAAQVAALQSIVPAPCPPPVRPGCCCCPARALNRPRH